MFTRKRWVPPIIPAGLEPQTAEYLRNLNKSVSDYLLGLEAKGSLTINEAEITANQGIKFPATQVSSTDANTLDDYEEGTWTPTITAGTGTFTTVSATGAYTKIGNRYFFEMTITITTNGTAAGSVKATLPSTPSGIVTAYGRENVVSGKALQGFSNVSQTLNIYDYSNAYPGASTAVLYVFGHYAA